MNWLGSSTASHGDAVDAGDARVVDTRQHVVQPVAELVEQRDHVVVRQQRGRAPGRRREVADQIGDRQGAGVARAFAPDALVHPGAAALLRPRVQDRGRSRAQFAVLADDSAW
jgi:hypothetical protein